MQRLTYRDLIHTYSENVSRGLADTDLSPRQRRLVTVMLNLASNTGSASVYYPPTQETRRAVVHHLLDQLHPGRFLALAMSSGPKAQADFEAAHERAIAILRGM